MKTPRSDVFGAIRFNIKTGTIWRFFDPGGFFSGDADNNTIRSVSYARNSANPTMIHKTDYGGFTLGDLSYVEYGPPTAVTPAGPTDETIKCSFTSPLIPLSPSADVLGMINRILLHGFFPKKDTDESKLTVYAGDGETILREIDFYSEGTKMLDLHFTPVFDYYTKLKIETPDKFMLYSPIIINPW